MACFKFSFTDEIDDELGSEALVIGEYKSAEEKSSTAAGHFFPLVGGE
jgi:hypothetical protein